MSDAPIASGARPDPVMTAHPTVKTSPNVPMNSVTYLRIRDSPARTGRLVLNVRDVAN
jgi:hypothetical protein